MAVELSVKIATEDLTSCGAYHKRALSIARSSLTLIESSSSSGAQRPEETLSVK